MRPLVALGVSLIVMGVTQTAFADEGEMCAEQSVVIELPAVAAPAEAEPEGGILWCASPDDPRCCPGDEIPGSTSIGGRPPMAGISMPTVGSAPPGDEHHFPPIDLHGVRPGFTHRIDRPPR